jgi:hypothetical protein
MATGGATRQGCGGPGSEPVKGAEPFFDRTFFGRTFFGRAYRPESLSLTFSIKPLLFSRISSAVWPLTKPLSRASSTALSMRPFSPCSPSVRADSGCSSSARGDSSCSAARGACCCSSSTRSVSSGSPLTGLASCGSLTGLASGRSLAVDLFSSDTGSSFLPLPRRALLRWHPNHTPGEYPAHRVGVLVDLLPSRRPGLRYIPVCSFLCVQIVNVRGDYARDLPGGCWIAVYIREHSLE